MSTQILLNPRADNHRTGRAWQRLQRECLSQLAPAEVTIVETAAEAEEVTRISALKGHRKIIAVGDAGTAHGMANAVMALAATHRQELGVGCLSVGRPGDWARTIDFPRRLRRQLEVLKAGHTLLHDLGRVECLDAQGRPVSRYFVNGAGFSLGGRLRHEWAGLRTSPAQAVRGVARTLGDFLLRGGPRLRLEGASGLIYEGPCSLGLVMAGRYYLALGQIAPQADPTDGELDVVWVGAKSAWQSIGQFFRLVGPRSGRAAGRGRARATMLRASSPTSEILLEADGQPIGRLPATFAIAPRALPVIVPQAAALLKKPRFAPLPNIRDGALAGNRRSATGRP